MKKILPINYIESGRIYIESTQRKIFLIKCTYCEENFSAWLDFWNHSKSHEQLIKIGESNVGEAPETMKELNANESFLRNSPKMEDLLEEGSVKETEMVLIAIKDIDNIESRAQEEVSSRTDEDQYIMDETSSNSNEYISDYSRQNTNLYSTSGISNDSKFYGDFMKTMSDSDNDCSNNEKHHFKSVYEDDQNKLGYSSSRISFNVRASNPHKALCLIEVIEHFPSLWNVNHPHYGIRLEQNRDYEQIAKILIEKYQIHSTNSELRLSFSDMRAWYQKETRTLERFPNRALTHPECYKALGKFLSSVLQKCITCNECEATFKKETQLATHKYKVHNGPLPFKCGFCNQAFAYQSQRRHHENRHTLGISYPCNQCNYKAPNQADLKLHMAKHSDKKPYICDVCGSSYKKSTSLNVHKRTHGKPRHKCSCGKVFFESYRYKIHLKTHKNLICDFCSKEFVSKRDLNNHVIDHVIEEKKKEIAARQMNLTEVEGFEREADSDDGLVEYLLSEDENTDNGSYFPNELSCLYCNADFTTSENLIKHLRRDHDENG